MKKLFSILLVVAMMATMSLTAFAETYGAEGGSHDVNAVYQEGSKSMVYSVDVTWGAMNFTYTATAQTWDDENHVWIDGASGGWSVVDNSNTITLENHSSGAVKATFSFAAENNSGVTGGTFAATGLADNALTLGAPTENVKAVTAYTVTFMPAGALASTFTSSAKIGSITITIEKAN